MTDYYDLYGLNDTNLSYISAAISQLLNIQLVPHSSAFLGDYFRFGKHTEENFMLQQNYVEEEEAWTEEEYPIYPTLLYVNNTQRPKEIEALLHQLFGDRITLLRRRKR